MARVAGCCRFVYNEALIEQKARYERGERKLGYAALCKQLTAWRNSAQTPWLKEAPTHPLQQALKDLERAYSNFFAGRAALPRLKRKGHGQSFRYPDPKQIRLDQSSSRLFLPKLGWLRYRASRAVLGEVRQVTVSRRAGKWFASIQTEREVTRQVPKATRVSGIDMGVIRFATMSNGEFLAPLGSSKRHEKALRKAQQTLSRKVRFSHNWRKARRRVEKIHTRIGHCRRDFLHKAGTFGPSRASTKPSSIRAGRSFAASCNTSSPGTAAGSSPCRRRARAAPVRPAGMRAHRTAAHRRTSTAPAAASRTTPIGSAHSTSFPEECSSCGTKGRTRRTLPPGAPAPQGAGAQPGSPAQ